MPIVLPFLGGARTVAPRSHTPRRGRLPPPTSRLWPARRPTRLTVARHRWAGHG